jgi:hypothetical protein
MSADNGILIRKNGAGQYEVRYYNASVDYESTDEMPILSVHDRIEDAIVAGQDQGTEYGLTFEGSIPRWGSISR